MLDRKKIGSRIKELRNLKKLTAEKVANSIDIDRSTLSNIERGDKTPGMEILIKLANFYNVTTDYILGLSDSPAPIPDNIKQILDQTSDTDEIVAVLNKNEKIKDSKIEKMINDLDEDSMSELVKYISYLKVRQALSPTNNDSSAGLDIKEIK